MLGGIPLEVFSLVDFRASRISLSRLVAAAASSVFRCKTCIAPRWLGSQFRATPELDDKEPIKKNSYVCDRFLQPTAIKVATRKILHQRSNLLYHCLSLMKCLELLHLVHISAALLTKLFLHGK